VSQPRTTQQHEVGFQTNSPFMQVRTSQCSTKQCYLLGALKYDRSTTLGVECAIMSHMMPTGVEFNRSMFCMDNKDHESEQHRSLKTDGRKCHQDPRMQHRRDPNSTAMFQICTCVSCRLGDNARSNGTRGERRASPHAQKGIRLYKACQGSDGLHPTCR
jgi:hypothetical protein